jgi:hypothetical protein
MLFCCSAHCFCQFYAFVKVIFECGRDVPPYRVKFGLNVG